MKKMKFFALVFGVTLAIFGSTNLTAQRTVITDPGDPGTGTGEGSRCDPPYTSKCTTIESPDGSTKAISGKKVTW